MLQELRNYFDRRRRLEEVAVMDEATLRDLGQSRDRIATMVSLPPDVPERVAGMAAIFGVARAEVTARRGDYLDMLEVCGRCHSRAACDRQLALGEAAHAGDSEFCANRTAFAHLAGPAAPLPPRAEA